MPNPSNTSPECIRCGACCCTFPIFASIEDAKREPRIIHESLKLAEWLGDSEWRYKLHPLPFHDSCCFLKSDSQTKERLCSIYDTRPAVCRKFEAGCIQCAEARARIGLPPISNIIQE